MQRVETKIRCKKPKCGSQNKCCFVAGWLPPPSDPREGEPIAQRSHRGQAQEQNNTDGILMPLLALTALVNANLGKSG